MPNSVSQKVDEKFQLEVARRASIAFNDQFINYQSSREVYSGSGSIVRTTGFKFNVAQRPSIVYSNPFTIDDIPLSEEPYAGTQSDLIESEEKEVQKLIYQVKASSIRYREKLANRLVTLFNDSKEEDLYGTGISAGSLRNFIKFLQLHTNLKYPFISLTPECNIYASWRDEQNRVFSVHFLPNGDARFVIFKPNYRHLERKIRISGLTTTDILMETVSPHNVSDWISE